METPAIDDSSIQSPGREMYKECDHPPTPREYIWFPFFPEEGRRRIYVRVAEKKKWIPQIRMVGTERKVRGCTYVRIYTFTNTCEYSYME